MLFRWVVFWMFLGGISVRCIRLGTLPLLNEDIKKGSGAFLANRDMGCGDGMLALYWGRQISEYCRRKTMNPIIFHPTQTHSPRFSIVVTHLRV